MALSSRDEKRTGPHRGPVHGVARLALCLGCTMPVGVAMADTQDPTALEWSEWRPVPSMVYLTGEEDRYADITRWTTTNPQNGGLGLWLGVSDYHRINRPWEKAYLSERNHLNLGLRWRSREMRGRRFDVSITAWQSEIENRDSGFSWSTVAPVQARAEVQWSGRKGRWAPEFGAIGIQLERDSKLVLRVRKGGPMVYYRAKF